MTCLHHAAHEGHDVCVKILLDNGSDATATTNVKNFKKFNYVVGAVKSEIIGCNDHHFIHPPILQTGWTALHFAAKEGHSACVKMLLSSSDVTAMTQVERHYDRLVAICDQRVIISFELGNVPLVHFLGWGQGA